MRLMFDNFTDQSHGTANLSHQDIDDIVMEAVSQAASGNYPEDLYSIIFTTLNPTDPCCALDLKVDQHLGVLITWSEFYPHQNVPVGVLQLEKTVKGYRVLALAGGAMATLHQGMTVMHFNPPIEYTLKGNASVIAWMLAARHNVHLPAEITDLIGEYASGVNSPG